MAQIVGVVMLVVAAWLLWSPWALVVGGIVMLAVPELVEWRRRRDIPVESPRS